MEIHVISTDDLGDRSYVVAEEGTAVVVDPQRDIDRVEAVLTEHGLTCALVLETHVHNDYVTGGYQLARRTGARYVVNADDPVRFERTGVRDGDRLAAGNLVVDVIATPGHTFTHLAYAVAGRDGRSAVFTGGSLLYGSVGRTDLIDAERTAELTRHQYESAHRLAHLLEDDVTVYPTHGFGSFCSSGAATGGDTSTIGAERLRNDALTTADVDEFVTSLMANLSAYPAYYAHLAEHNLAGPDPVDLSAPEPVDPWRLRDRLAAGEWVIDLRDRSAYAAGHLVGTINVALGGQFSTYVGWLVPWGVPLTLVADSAEEVATAQRQLARIGIDRPAGAATSPLATLAAGHQPVGYREVGFDDPAFRPGSPVLDPTDESSVILDVRRDEERAADWLPGSRHVPLHELLTRLEELPVGPEYWVHCRSGYRAAIAASLLARAGHRVVLVKADFPLAA